MLLEFIATISAGVGAAGVIVGVQKLTRANLPKWAMPVAAGTAMIGFSIWSDYSWASRAEVGVGEGKVIAMTVDKKQVWRPWTFLAPVTTQFIALDKDGAERHGATVVTDMYLVSRRADSAIVPVVFDCLMERRASATTLSDGPWSDDTLAALDWVALDTNDPTLRTACDDLR